MKNKIFIFLFVLIAIIVNVSKAENVGNCEVIFDGKCYDKNLNINQTEQKCKTMINGKCTEYYIQNNSTQFDNNEIKQNMTYMNKRETKKTCQNLFGFGFITDPYYTNWLGYQTRVFVVDVVNNSPAQRAGLNAGDEIIKMNGNKVTRFKSNNDTYDYVFSQQHLVLDIKSPSGMNKNISMHRGEVCTIEETEPFFDAYWGQISKTNLEAIYKRFLTTSYVINQCSPRYKEEFNYERNGINGALAIKEQFRNGFNLCLENSYNMTDANNCLTQLVNKFQDRIAHEQELEMQRSALQAQQQMQQQQIDALNNYAYSLRNQHVDTNIQHSGTINVNKNIYGTMYHYNHW